LQRDELVVLARGGGGTDRASYNRVIILKAGVGEEKALGLMVDDTGVMSVACDKLLPITEEFASFPFQVLSAIILKPYSINLRFGARRHTKYCMLITVFIQIEAPRLLFFDPSLEWASIRDGGLY
jgi:hypothetical protein